MAILTGPSSRQNYGNNLRRRQKENWRQRANKDSNIPRNIHRQTQSLNRGKLK